MKNESAKRVKRSCCSTWRWFNSLMKSLHSTLKSKAAFASHGWCSKPLFALATLHVSLAGCSLTIERIRLPCIFQKSKGISYTTNTKLVNSDAYAYISYGSSFFLCGASYSCFKVSCREILPNKCTHYCDWYCWLLVTSRNLEVDNYMFLVSFRSAKSLLALVFLSPVWCGV